MGNYGNCKILLLNKGKIYYLPIMQIKNISSHNYLGWKLTDTIGWHGFLHLPTMFNLWPSQTWQVEFQSQKLLVRLFNYNLQLILYIWCIRKYCTFPKNDSCNKIWKIKMSWIVICLSFIAYHIFRWWNIIWTSMPRMISMHSTIPPSKCFHGSGKSLSNFLFDCDTIGELYINKEE